MADNPEVDWDKLIAQLIGTNTRMTLTQVEKRLIDLKGMEQPNDSYSKGYRDAIDMMVIAIGRMIEQSKKIGEHIPEWKPNE